MGAEGFIFFVLTCGFPFAAVGGLKSFGCRSGSLWLRGCGRRGAGAVWSCLLTYFLMVPSLVVTLGRVISTHLILYLDQECDDDLCLQRLVFLV